MFHRPFQPDIGPQDSKTGWTHSPGTRQHCYSTESATSKAGAGEQSCIQERSIGEFVLSDGKRDQLIRWWWEWSPVTSGLLKDVVWCVQSWS